MKTKQTLRQEAQERQAKHDLLSVQLKLTKLDLRDGNAHRERARLIVPAAPVRLGYRRAHRPATDESIERVIALTEKTVRIIRDLGDQARIATDKILAVTGSPKAGS